ncbi:MAG: GNAT family N-acetyltransferase [Candidatus Dormibacteraeota bacterium]|nr:GNAT family N-acetyltransferase [Candidatus Dormibacteraeota bacterium]
MSGETPTRVRLRGAGSGDGTLLDLWNSSPHYRGSFNDFGQAPSASLSRVLARPGLISDERGLLLVERSADATPLGTVTWHAVSHGPNPESRAWNIGIALIPEGRGHGYGVEAQQLLARHLFATTQVNRIEASTDVENVAEQRALEKAGFSREGVLRGAQFRAGAWHDMMLYSLLRQDVSAVRG